MSPLALLLPWLAFAAEPERIDLPHAVEAAVRGATLALKQDNAVDIAGANLLNAYGVLLPNLQLSADYSLSSGKTMQPYNGITIIDSASRSAQFQVSSTLNLFRGFGDVSAIDADERRKKSALLTLDRARQQIALDVTQSFLQAVLDDELVQIARRNLDVSLERLRLFREGQKLGATSPADVYRQEAQAAQDEATWVGAKNRAHIDLLALLRRLRFDAKKDYELVPPELPEPNERPHPASTTDLVSGALRDRRDLRAREEDAKASASDVTHAASAFYPTLDLTASYLGAGAVYSRLNSNSNVILPPSQNTIGYQLGTQDTAALALVLHWDIFTGFSTTADVRKARDIESDTEIDRDDQSNEVVIEVKQADDDLGAAYDQWNAAKAGLKASEKAYEILRERYRLRASSFLDLITAQAQLTNAQATRAQALVNYNLRVKAMRYARGLDP